MHSFSYFPGLSSSQKVTDKEKDENSLKKKKLNEVSPDGREAIFGELDMDDFYTQEDELIYFINPEELKNVETPTTSGAESSGNEEDISSRSNTTYTSRSNTVKASSEVESENELWALWICQLSIFFSSGSNLRGLRNILLFNNTSEIKYFPWPKNLDYLGESQWFRQFSEYHIDRLEIVDFLQRNSFLVLRSQRKVENMLVRGAHFMVAYYPWVDWLPYNLVPRAFPLKVGGKSPGNEVAMVSTSSTSPPMSVAVFK